MAAEWLSVRKIGVVAWLRPVDRCPLPPERNSRHSIAVGHAEVGHRVENLARHLDLHALSIERPASHTSTDYRLVSEHCILDQAASAVA